MRPGTKNPKKGGGSCWHLLHVIGDEGGRREVVGLGQVALLVEEALLVNALQLPQSLPAGGV